MIKLNASYSKKVPAGQEYSSHSYHASLELEIPSGLSADQLKQKIHETFALARDSVEAELHGQPVSAGQPCQLSGRNENNVPHHKGGQTRNTGGRNPNEPASNKQIAFLTDLLKRGNFDIGATCANYGVQSLYDLTRKQCSEIIDGLRQSKAA